MAAAARLLPSVLRQPRTAARPIFHFVGGECGSASNTELSNDRRRCGTDQTSATPGLQPRKLVGADQHASACPAMDDVCNIKQQLSSD